MCNPRHAYSVTFWRQLRCNFLWNSSYITDFKAETFRVFALYPSTNFNSFNAFCAIATGTLYNYHASIVVFFTSCFWFEKNKVKREKEVGEEVKKKKKREEKEKRRAAHKYWLGRSNTNCYRSDKRQCIKCE